MKDRDHEGARANTDYFSLLPADIITHNIYPSLVTRVESDQTKDEKLRFDSQPLINLSYTNKHMHELFHKTNNMYFSIFTRYFYHKLVLPINMKQNWVEKFKIRYAREYGKLTPIQCQLRKLIIEENTEEIKKLFLNKKNHLDHNEWLVTDRSNITPMHHVSKI